MNHPTEPAPTGRREDRDGTSYVVLTRSFAAPVADVWAAVTEPERLERWIGTWTGDPASGSVAFRMTSEGEDVPEETFRIEECVPPRRLHGTIIAAQGGDWRVEVDLAEAGGVTTLTFAQVMTDADLAASVGPGWEYYLDRLVAAETGDDVAGLDWESYPDAQSLHYRALFADQG